MSASVVLLAAGRGKRFGSGSPKQFIYLKGKPLFLASLNLFLKNSFVKEIVLVTLPRQVNRLDRMMKKIKTKKRLVVVPGGRYRGESVKNGIQALDWLGQVVLVHDAVRPMVTNEIIGRVVRAAQRFGCALPAWPLPDTLKQSDKRSRVKKTIPRKNLWLAQTPQGFRKEVALKCLLKPWRNATDDVQLAERKGYKVKLVLGGATNIKVTYPHDLKLCRSLMN